MELASLIVFCVLVGACSVALYNKRSLVWVFVLCLLSLAMGARLMSSVFSVSFRETKLAETSYLTNHYFISQNNEAFISAQPSGWISSYDYVIPCDRISGGCPMGGLPKRFHVIKDGNQMYVLVSLDSPKPQDVDLDR